MKTERDTDLGRRLREWDPVEHHPVPDRQTWARLRSDIEANSLRRGAGWLPPLVTTTALALAGLAVVLSSPRPEPGSAVGTVPLSTVDRLERSLGTSPLEIHLVSANGTRVYWSLPPSSDSQLDPEVPR